MGYKSFFNNKATASLLHPENKIKKGLLFLIGLVLAAFFVFPFYILGLNSFKTQKDLFLDVLSVPNAETATFENLE